MASDDPDLADETPAVPSRRKRRAALFVSGGLVLAVAAIWVLRAPIADNFVSTQLQQRGVKAQYRIVSIGTRTQTLADVVIGDPAKPDLIARLVKVNIGWTWSGPVISGVSAEGVRLFGRWQDGRIRLGEVDKLLPEPSDEPFRLPELDVALSDARARLDTPWGAVGARVDGAGPLRYNWRGQVALVSDGLTHAGCDTGRVSVFGAVRISFARPNFTGPVRAAKLRCAQADFSLGRIDSQLEASLAADFLSWTGEFDATSSRWRGAGGTLASLTATGNFRGDTKATKVDYDLRGGAARYGGFSVAGLSLIGAATIGSEPTASARLGVARAVLPPQYRTQVAQSGAMLRSTPVGSIAEQLTRAAANALTSLSGEADVLLVGDAKTRRIEIVAPRLRSVSGAQLRGDASSRLSVRLAGKQPQFLVDGRWQLEGGGLPDSDVRLQRAANGRLTGLASLKPLVAGDSRLALTPVTIIGDPNGRLRIVTTAALSGPLAGGRVDGLTMMLDATVQPNGDFALAGGCQRVSLAGAALAGVTLGSNAVQLCGARGQPLLAYRGGRLSGELALIAPKISGRTGDSLLAVQAARLQYGLASGLIDVEALAVAIGDGEPATNFTAEMVNGTLAGGAMSGRLEGAAGEIGEIPLNMTEIAGDWAWRNSMLTLNGGLVVSDRTEVPRFSPLISRDATLTFADNRIVAKAGFNERATDTPIGNTDIVHDFNSASGGADLLIMAMRFNENFQPDQLTPLALGIIANTRGTLAGRGRIDWNADGVTSSGTFTTAGSDFAAAFGSVRGASTTIVFDDLLGFRTRPGQRASIDEINPGIPVIGGLIDYQLLDANKIQIEGGRWPFAGGELTLKPTTIDFDVNAVRRLEFELHGVDAGVFLTEFGFDNINAKGVFDGVLPVEFSGLGGRIVDGRLVARSGGGEVAYIGELTNYNLGVFANYAFNMLKSLAYEEMTITLNGDLDGEMLTDVKIVGLKQGSTAERNIITRQLEKLPIVFNVKINAPFRQLIGSARSLYDPSVLIDQNRDALIEAQRAAEGTSVQPPESEPVP